MQITAAVDRVYPRYLLPDGIQLQVWDDTQQDSITVAAVPARFEHGTYGVAKVSWQRALRDGVAVSLDRAVNEAVGRCWFLSSYA